MTNPKVVIAECRARMAAAFVAYQARGERGDARLQGDVDAALMALFDAGVEDGVRQGRVEVMDKVRSVIDSIEEDT